MNAVLTPSVGMPAAPVPPKIEPTTNTLASSARLIFAISAQKSMLGHTLGAAGALESVATIQAIREGAVPPTINLVDPDERTNGLDLTPNEATRRPIRAALNNSFGFGGQNAAIIFKRWDG